MDYRALILALFTSLPLVAQWGVQFFNPVNYYIDLNATNVRLAWQVRPWSDIEVRKVAYQVYTVTTGGTVRISLQGRDASGWPDGNELAFVERNIAANGHYVDTFSTPVTITRGTPVWIVVRGAPEGSVVIAFFRSHAVTYMNASYANSLTQMFDVVGAFTTSWGLSSAQSLPSPGFVLLAADDSPIATERPQIIEQATSASTSSSPNEGGIACTFTRPMTLVGIGRLRNTGGTEDSEYRVYRQGVQIAAFASAPAPSGPALASFTQGVEPVQLLPGVEYTISFKPLSTTSQNVHIYTRLRTAIGDYFAGNWYLRDACTNVSRTDAGAWSRGGSAQYWDVRPIFVEALATW